MQGYSNKPLALKLGIKPGFRVLLLNAPVEFPAELGTLSDDVMVARQGEPGEADVVLFFAFEGRDLRAAFPATAKALKPRGMVWIAWPKKSSGLKTDVTEKLVREVGLSTGLVDVKVCAVNEVWSGLKFLHRRS